MRRWGRRAAGILLAGAAFGLLAGCELLLPPTSAPASSEPAPRDIAWPPLAPDPGLTDDARRLCLPDFGVAPDIPVALQDRREPNRARVLFADNTTVAYCTVVRTPQGTITDGGAGMQRGWPKGVGMVATPSGLTITDATMAAKGSDWGNVSGLVPPGGAAIRALIGERRVDGVVGDGFYSLSWQGLVVPTFLVALDGGGREIARIDAVMMSRIWVRNCPPGALGCPPPLVPP